MNLFERLRKAYIPILAQITVPFILLAFALAAGGVYLVTKVVVDSVQERFDTQLIETGRLADESIVREESKLLESLRLVSNVTGVSDAVVAGDATTLRNLILPLAYNSGLEALAIVKTNGAVLLSLDLNPQNQLYESLTLTNPYKSLDFVSPVLHGVVDDLGDKYGGVVNSSAGYMLLIAGPIKDANGNLVGAAVVGRSLIDLADTIRSQTLAQVSFYTLAGEPLTTTLFEPQTLDAGLAQAAETNQDVTYHRDFSDAASSYMEGLGTFEIRAGDDLGLMGVALPRSFFDSTAQITRGNTLILVAVSVGLVLIMGTVVAGRITRPIRDLKEAAQKVAGGNLQVKVLQRGSDEVGVLGQSFNQMVDSLSKSKQDLVEAYDETIEGWARALDMRDHETEGHSRRVSDLATALASAMGVRGSDLEHLRRGALLHDVGKIAIPDGILNKPGKLTPDEMAQMRLHPTYAKEFMGTIAYLQPAMDIPKSHHEKWDGSGYPQGFKATQIPLAARIFAIVDVWDALTSDRPYRKAMAFNEAMKYIESESGKHFDPEVVKAFKKLMGR